jgi:hypothetical protein
VDSFLPKLRLDLSNLYVYLEFCDNYFYDDCRSDFLCFSDSSHQSILKKLDEPFFPLADYFFSLISNLLDSASLAYDQYMNIIHRYFYSSPHLPPCFQKKLYLDLIGHGMTGSAISSTFGFEDLSRDVLSVILSYMDFNSARNMLLVNNMFYFGLRDYLTCCHECL